MEKLIDRLIEKHLLKDIKRITLAVYKERFQGVFNDACNKEIQKDTTLGYTFRKLEELALVEVVDFMGEWLEEINLTRAMSRENPFYELLWDFWYDAKDYLYFNDYITAILDEEYHDKRIELEKIGIINNNGDYIQVGI